MSPLRASLLLALLTTTGALAQQFDFVATGYETYCGLQAGEPYYIDEIEWHPRWSETDTDIALVAAMGAGRVIAARSGWRIELFELRADRAEIPFYSGLDGHEAQGLAVDRSGNVYVLTRQREGQLNTYSIAAITSAGSLRAIYPVGASEWPGPYTRAWDLDLASDQCTLIFIDDSGIRRVDGCNGTALPDFPSSDFPAATRDLAILPGGEVLASNNHQLRRYSADGALRWSRTLSYSGAITLTRSGAAVLASLPCGTSSTGHYVAELDLETGEQLRRTVVDLAEVRSLVASNGWTAALGSTATRRRRAVR